MKPRVRKVGSEWICYWRCWGGEKFTYGATPLAAAQRFFRKYPEVEAAIA